MIREIINYTQHLKEKAPLIFEKNLEPTKGLHIFIEFDGEGNVINFPGEKGEQWDFYDGKEKSEFINKVVPFDLASTYITMNKQKKFDPKQKIHSASPFAIAFNFNFSNEDKIKYGIEKSPDKKRKTKNDRLIKTKRFEIVSERIEDYFTNTKKVFEIKNEDEALCNLLNNFLLNKLNNYISENKKEFIEIRHYWGKIKEKEYVKLYVKNIDLQSYEDVYKSYLGNNIFNKDKYNIQKGFNTYGAIDFYSTFSDNKQFLKHKTGMSKDGIGIRFTGEDAQLLNLFDKIRKSKIFPNPLPIFIDKNEFKNTDEFIRIFKEDGKLNYSQILKKVFKNNSERILQNYYILFFSGMILEDFDYVSKFRYSLEESGVYPKIINLFELSQNKELIGTNTIKNIFQFEAAVVTILFNGALVKVEENEYNTHYFGEIKPEYVSGGEPVFQMVMKYRKSFYDFIYKSKTQTLNTYMWDEILWNSIIADLRSDKRTEKGYNSKDYSIKVKLNIWFSLYNYFNNNQQNRIDMASKIPELIEKTKMVANNDEQTLDTVEEFAFAAGQVIYFLLNQSKASERTHALLEPFLQKVKTVQLQNSIAQTINTYKHEISFGKGRFERLSAQVLAYETSANLKDYQRLLLAGYFAPAAIYEKKEESINN